MRREPSDTESIPLILSFHQVHDRVSFGVTNYAPGRFFRLMAFLRDRGYEFVSVESAVTEPRSNRLAVCFDDGYQHLLEVLPRAMDEFGVKPTVFIPTAYVGRTNAWDYSHKVRPMRHLHEGEIRELSQAGVEFGSHGHSHVALTGLPTQELERELVRSKRGLEELTGLSVGSISYPFGRWDEKVLEAAHTAGYRYGFTMRYPQTGGSMMAIGRMAVYAFDSPIVVEWKLRPGVLRIVEMMKARVANGLSGGTILLNRLRR